MKNYMPEGYLIDSELNRFYTSGTAGLEAAFRSGDIIEAYCTMCGEDRSLYFRHRGIKGRIDRALAAPADSKDISLITCVGRPISFKVVGKAGDTYIFSRKAAMEEAIECIMDSKRNGEIIDARVTHLARFGAFVDIGCGNISMIGIENISVSRINHPSDRFVSGQRIKSVITAIDRCSSRITLSHKELLGTWKENAAGFTAGQTVRGIVRGVERYGAFIELAPNLSGLAEPVAGLTPGKSVSVFIKSIIPEKAKIKLIVININGDSIREPITDKDYYIASGMVENWKYLD